MNKEQYVTFEVAKLLKEKGFDWECAMYYNAQHDEARIVSDTFICNWNDESLMERLIMSGAYSIPTQQMAMRWLWEEKGLNINAIYGDYPTLKKSFWMPQIDSLNGCYGVDDEDFFREYDSREDCIEAALIYTLNNLI